MQIFLRYPQNHGLLTNRSCARNLVHSMMPGCDSGNEIELRKRTRGLTESPLCNGYRFCQLLPLLRTF